MTVPNRTRVLVIGGGPAGSTAAGFLAREGIDVTLIERATFPRYHIGESLLPSCLEILELLGAREAVEARGFQRKPGAYLEWKGERWTLDFGELRGHYQSSFQVPRAEFDHVLLQHAAAQGVHVFEGIAIREIAFDGERPVAASWVACAPEGDNAAEFSASSGRIEFDYLVDASGRAGMMANRYLKNRRFHDMFKNVAVWGYWQGAKHPPECNEGVIAVGSIPDGWLWAIPFSDGRMSIGVVMHRDAYVKARQTRSLEQAYCDAIEASPLLTRVTASGQLMSGLQVEQDYSYNAERFAGPGYFLAGDSACFLDPLLSTGVHLAMYSGMLAAASIASLDRGEVSDGDASSYYEQSYRQTYLRFLVFVSAFYEARGKLGYYSAAEKLSHYDADPDNLRRAFLNLVSGLEDMADAEYATSHLMGEMSRRIDENLALRENKAALRDQKEHERVDDNARFFDAIEGLSLLSPEGAVGGFYVATTPRLGLVRAVTDSHSMRA